jgi:tetratricopeptide (TPR) repeat protein
MRILHLGMSTAMLTCLLWTGGASAGGEKGPKARAEKASVYVLPQGSEKTISKLLNLGQKTPNGASLSATVKESGVEIRIGSKTKPALRVTLVHPSTAPKGAIKVRNISVLPSPGPAPRALVTDIIARLKKSALSLPWQKVVPRPSEDDLRREKEEADAKKKQEELEKANEAKFKIAEESLSRAVEWISLGETLRAKKLLMTIDTANNNGLQISVAAALMRAGAKKKSLRMIAAIKPASALEKLELTLLRGTLPRGAKALKGIPKAKACSAAIVATRALEFARFKEAVDLSRTIRKAAPGCVQAWEIELRGLSELKTPNKDLKVLVEKALGEVGNAGSIHQIASEVYRFGGDNLRAIEESMLAARTNPKEPGRLEGLARAMSEDPAVLMTYLEKVIKQNLKGNGALVREFALGVAYHLAQRYKQSQTYLQPLSQVFPHSSILAVYLALNEFNLGAKKEAARRLQSTRVKTEHDIELYYFRAEVLRDVKRDKAISDLKKLIPLLTKSSKSSATELRRVQALLTALEMCKKKKIKVCEADWLHPKTAGPQGQPTIKIPATLGTIVPMKHATKTAPKQTASSQKDEAGSDAPKTKSSEETDPENGDDSEAPENPLLIILLGLGLLVGVVVLRRNMP